MREQLTPQQLQELLDDFYAECDEQLVAARAVLNELTKVQAGSPAFRENAETLFRHLHSIKGNSAIVGLEAAEEVAHAAEEFLRHITRGTHVLTQPSVDAIDRALNRLADVLSAHRTQCKLPDVHDIRDEIARLLNPASPRDVGAAPLAPGSSGHAAAEREIWEFVFTPSKVLEGRGINVSTVRARLATEGEILSSAPRIKGPNAIEFIFKVRLRASSPIDAEAWQTDGVTLSRVEAAPEASTVPAPEENRSSSLFVAPSHFVRVDMAKLDELMRIAGELVIHRSRLEGKIAQVGELQNDLREVSQGLGKSLKELREAITRVRLVQVSEIFSRIPSIVRELSRNSDKQVELKIEGEETEIDKHLVERLKEPLLHLVRNAFSHGVESPEKRAAAHKPPVAQIRLKAQAAGDRVLIEVKDDGAGVNAYAVLARARAAGLPIPTEINDQALLGILCAPGFSTRDAADMVAGRGVGMSVVLQTVRDLGGHLSMSSTVGQGTCFTLQLPLTLSILDTILVTTGTQLCAVPLGSVSELLQVPSAEVRRLSNVEVVPYRDGVLPITRLNQIFKTTSKQRAEHPLLVIDSERGSNGLLVDQVLGQREVVLRPLKDPLVQVPGIYGAAELGDGRPLLILDPRTLTSGAVRPTSATT